MVHCGYDELAPAGGDRGLIGVALVYAQYVGVFALAGSELFVECCAQYVAQIIYAHFFVQDSGFNEDFGDEGFEQEQALVDLGGSLSFLVARTALYLLDMEYLSCLGVWLFDIYPFVGSPAKFRGSLPKDLA